MAAILLGAIVLALLAMLLPGWVFGAIAVVCFTIFGMQMKQRS